MLRRRIVVGILVVCSLALLTVYFRESSSGGLHNLQSAGSSVLRPFEVAAERVARPFRDAAHWVSGLSSARSENAKLRKQNDAYRRELVQLGMTQRENTQLRKLLQYRDGQSFTRDYVGLATRVVARPPGLFDQRIVVAVGKADGVAIHDPVVTDEGLVGQVTKVANHLSQVTLLTDPSSAVSALDPRTGANGIVQLNDTGSAIIMDQVSKADNVFAGDALVTAGWKTNGLSSIYPRGLPIGTISSVNQTDIDPYKEIVAKPLVDFSSLESVLVLIPKVTTTR